MAVRLYTTSKDAWSAIYARMEGADISIYIEMFIFTDDTAATHDFANMLKEKAASGVQVILVLDVYGSSRLSNGIVQELRAAGAEVRFFKHIIHRTHRKLVLVDGRYAFLGGVNITEHARDWDDLLVEFSGFLVRRLVTVFARTYRLTGGSAPLHYPSKAAHLEHKAHMWLLEHSPLSGAYNLQRHYQRRFLSAKSAITIVTPYFVPGRWMVTALRDAVSRGVSVRILLPQTTDSRFLDNINRYFAGQVEMFGAEVFFLPGMNHAKALLVDETEGLVGSANADGLSFSIMLELGIFFKDASTIAKLRTAIDDWIRRSVPYDTGTHALRWYQSLLIPVIRLLRPIL